MKTLSADLQALLASRSFWSCDLFAFTLADGTMLRYAAGDCDVKDTDGAVYSCGAMSGPFLVSSENRPTIHQKLGTDVDTLTFEVIPGAGTVNGVAFLRAVRQGAFKGARLTLLAAYAAAPPVAGCWPVAVVGTLVRFIGYVAEIDGGGTVLTITVNSPLERLQRDWPRNLYQPDCVAVVGDAACGVSLSAYQVTGTVAAGSTAATIRASLGGQASDYFSLGTVEFTSGVNAGLKRSVRAWTTGSPGTLVLMTPFPAAPAAGDAVTVTPGCQGGMSAQGCPKFANLARFRGFPYVPPPSTAGV